MLKVKKLDPRAILPTVAHPGEDLAYDLYALEDMVLVADYVATIRTGIAAQAYRQHSEFRLEPLGLLIRDRSSMACKGLFVVGGVIDPGYTGEISVLMTRDEHWVKSNTIRAGDKFAQMIPLPVLTGEVIEVSELRESARGKKGFGSSGT